MQCFKHVTSVFNSRWKVSQFSPLPYKTHSINKDQYHFIIFKNSNKTIATYKWNYYTFLWPLIAKERELARLDFVLLKDESKQAKQHTCIPKTTTHIHKTTTTTTICQLTQHKQIVFKWRSSFCQMIDSKRSDLDSQIR